MAGVGAALGEIPESPLRLAPRRSLSVESRSPNDRVNLNKAKVPDITRHKVRESLNDRTDAAGDVRCLACPRHGDGPSDRRASGGVPTRRLPRPRYRSRPRPCPRVVATPPGLRVFETEEELFARRSTESSSKGASTRTWRRRGARGSSADGPCCSKSRAASI